MGEDNLKQIHFTKEYLNRKIVKQKTPLGYSKRVLLPVDLSLLETNKDEQINIFSYDNFCILANTDFDMKSLKILQDEEAKDKTDKEKTKKQLLAEIKALNNLINEKIKILEEIDDIT